MGRDKLKQRDYAAAAGHFLAAIDLDERVIPAHLSLGDVRFFDGDVAAAEAAWERVADVAPERAYLAFERFESLLLTQPDSPRFQALCQRLIDANPQDWRAHTALARHLLGRGSGHEALELLFEALSHSPHAIKVHQDIWHTLVALGLDASLVNRYIELTRQSVFYLDPHVCQRCHYRSTELLWQCPHCHEWDSFVEDRIAPAQEVR